MVTDQYQYRGLGTELLRRLIEIARNEKLDRIIAEMLQENLACKPSRRDLASISVPQMIPPSSRLSSTSEACMKIPRCDQRHMRM